MNIKITLSIIFIFFIIYLYYKLKKIKNMEIEYINSKSEIEKISEKYRFCNHRYNKIKNELDKAQKINKFLSEENARLCLDADSRLYRIIDKQRQKIVELENITSIVDLQRNKIVELEKIISILKSK